MLAESSIHSQLVGKDCEHKKILIAMRFWRGSSGSSGRPSSGGGCWTVLLLLLITFAVIKPLLDRYGIGLMGPRKLHITEEQHSAILKNHTFLIIGGPHRGGTTIFWRLLAAHPLVSGFAEHGIESDFAEGAFLQTVLPTFGVGTEMMGSQQRRRVNLGLGRYAFSPQAHMTEQHPLATQASSLQLVSEWGFHWNLSKPVLLEKT